jgi:glycosyltransferase involved in cell wall biosynthesis
MQYTKGHAERPVYAYCQPMTKQKPLRVAIICRLAFHGRLDGIGWYIEQITRHLATVAPDLSLTLLFDRSPHPTLVPKGASAQAVGFPARHPSLWWIWFEQSIPRWVRANKPDVLVSLEGFLPSTVPCKTVTVIHDIAFEHSPGHMKRLHRAYYRWKIPAAIRSATTVCAVSEFTRSDLEATYGIDPSTVTVIPNGVRSSFAAVRHGEQPISVRSFTDGSPYWLFVGTMQPRKNIIRMIQAFEQFSETVADPGCLVLAGKKGWLDDEITAALENSSVRHRIHLTGWVDDATLADLYAHARAVLFVPLLEGFGVPVIEAFASGVPVVTSNTSSLPEVAGEAAVTVDPLSVADITRGMVRVWDDDGLRQQLVERGFERVKAYQWPAIAARFADVIRAAASRQ